VCNTLSAARRSANNNNTYTVILFSAHTLHVCASAAVGARGNFFYVLVGVSEFCFSPSFARSQHIQMQVPLAAYTLCLLCFRFFAPFCCKCSIGCPLRFFSVSFCSGRARATGFYAHTDNGRARVFKGNCKKRQVYL
jgi:hypothetical protein